MVHQECMEHGVSEGWWPSYDDTGPHPWPVFYILQDSVLRRPLHGTLDYYGCPTYSFEPLEISYLSQLLAHIGVYASVAIARKAGFNRKIEVQELWFKKHRQGATHLYIDLD
jgi:hypothetical protein